MKTSLLKNAPKKILFANVPGDGHFNPLTGIAVHLKAQGHDVRWYSSANFKDKIDKLNIHHYPFKKALEAPDNDFYIVFPEMNKIKNQIKKLASALINVFILRGPEYFEDLKELRKEFTFDLVVCDCLFTGIPFIKEKFGVPVISIGVLPLTETSKDLAPAGLGMKPVNSFAGRTRQSILRFVADKVLFRKPTRIMKKILKQHGITPAGSNVLDLLVRKSTLLLQSGTPGFEYQRSDLGSNIRFLGPLLPYSSGKRSDHWYHEKLKQFSKVILVTQGTVEKDWSKLLLPTLEAFKNTNYLVVATTGGSGTKELKEKFVHENIIIEDFISFADIMPYADAYITNGGYGGVMLSIQNKLPMVVAGIHEGKNEINARVEYFKLGINLRTETPMPLQIKDSVEKLLHDETYYNSIQALSREFSRYNPNELVEKYIGDVLNTTTLILAALPVM